MQHFYLHVPTPSLCFQNHQTTTFAAVVGNFLVKEAVEKSLCPLGALEVTLEYTAKRPNTERDDSENSVSKAEATTEATVTAEIEVGGEGVLWSAVEAPRGVDATSRLEGTFTCGKARFGVLRIHLIESDFLLMVCHFVRWRLAS